MLKQIADLERVARQPEDWQRIAKAYMRLAKLYPNDHRFLANSAHAQWLSGDAASARLIYRQAVLLKPDCHILYRGIGNALVDIGDFAAAERAYRHSLDLCVDEETRWNLSQLLIGMGRLEEGYELAENRWAMKRVTAWRPGQITTQQDALDSKQPLLIWSEQGFGDIFQHLPWIFRLQKMRGNDAQPLRLEVEGCLAGLMRRLIRHLNPRPHVHEKDPHQAGPWDGQHVSLLSLPRLLGFSELGKMQRQESLSRAFAPVAKSANCPRVGLVWAAGRKLDDPIAAREYWLRSLDQQTLGRLIQGVSELGCQCVLMQFGPDRDAAAPWSGLFAHQLSENADFEVTAELVMELDLVITVDTAMAHLAGLLSKPVWVLLPYCAAPRWGRGSSTTPWYPTMKLFRQEKPWEWSSPIDQLLQALSSHILRVQAYTGKRC
ncbi:MAG: hypothetical protein VKI42_09005 [Synechococcaceae cyanobacterium]|nr:hypothetical protein [Synechococcaceae cyanobacterium]